MTTLHLLIVCATVLGVVFILARSLTLSLSARARCRREQERSERAALVPTAELAAAVDALRSLKPPELSPSRVGQRVTVHTKQPDDQTFFGVVESEFTDRLALIDCELVTAVGARPLPGTQHIERADISWVDDHGHVGTSNAERRPEDGAGAAAVSRLPRPSGL